LKLNAQKVLPPASVTDSIAENVAAHNILVRRVRFGPEVSRM